MNVSFWPFPAGAEISISEPPHILAITVGADRDYPPYEFIDRNGEPAGYNVDLTRAIARVMGMKVEFVFGGWSEMRTALAKGTVDVLQGISYSEERAKTLAFSPPHTIVNHAIFARRGTPPVSSFEELRGKEVIVFKDGIMHDTLRGLGFDKELYTTDTPAGVMRLLASGEHDYAVVAMLPGMYLIRELKLDNLVPVATSVSTQRYCYAVKAADTEILSRINEGLAILKQTGEYYAIYNKWLGVLEPPRFPWERTARYGVTVLVALVLGLAGTVTWSRMLQRKVAQRTMELAQEAAERKRALEELRRHQDQLVQADKMASLGILVSGVAHEINNPTGLILFNTPVVASAFADAETILEEHYRAHGDFMLGGIPYSRMRSKIPEMLDDMQEGAKRIKRIVEDLKDFARRSDDLPSVPVDINMVVGLAVRLVEVTIRKATEHFTVSYGNNLPPVRGHAQRIEQVVVNLILNACQSLPSPSRAVVLETGCDEERRTVWIRVHDEGVGIAPEHLAHLTDPFFTTKRESGGTGLGLSVSAGIVEEHGGTLHFDSRPGEGTTVLLTLPAAT
ncbi:MAG: transporter substrate-binding domain-containing protein [Deltaproteobacteria bacterium]|nr:MAG: transporter substrate-binding domain-containing protein [Deltaproteobacteria bacterium]